MIQLNERRFNQLALLAVLSGFVALIAAFLILLGVIRQGQQSNERVDHSYQVADSVNELTLLIERAENARRGYLLRPEPYRSQVYTDAAAGVLPALERLTHLVADNPIQIARINQLRPLVLAELSQLEASMDLALSGNIVEAHRRFTYVLGFTTLRRIRALAKDISAREDRYLAARREAEMAGIARMQWLLGAIGLVLLAVGLGTFWLMRRYVADLNASRARLHQLNTNLEGLVDERTADLQRANAEIQRFAYIVSHDLRSPLVNVLGFTAELESADKLLKRFLDQLDAEQPGKVPEPVRLAVAEDLPEAIGFIRSSTQKMDRLINAILALSRQGRRVLAPAALDMDQLVGGIADSLATVAQDRGATITIETPLPGLHHDRLAIEQIFSNLIENATKYLQPGRPGEIAIRGRRDGQRVRFEVEDNGRGVDPHDHERIFELFRRAGRQDQTGEGIGLANVRALAHRLGGTVTISSALTEGSTFIVDLPAVYTAQGEEE